MGVCATKLRQAFEGEKPEPLVEVEVEVEVEEDKKAEEEHFKERVKEIVGENESGSEIAVAADEIQGCKQRPSLSLLFKQEEVKNWAESEKPKNETKGKQEPILEAQDSEPTRPNEEEEERDTSQQTKSEDVVASSAS